MRFVALLGLCASFGFALAGCESHRLGPERPITIADDVSLARALVDSDLAIFSSASPAAQASLRNEIVTARMYIADVEYHAYEARLTKELQDEGLLATATSLALTTSATLVPVAQTKTLLSGLATAVTGLDKAYNEKELLSHTIQALQTQMRADRKTEAGVIYAKIFKGPGVLTPIGEYTLAMALSDMDSYYQAGTISSAMVGLSSTLAAKEKSADIASALAGPNPEAVASVKLIASPPAAGTATIPKLLRSPVRGVVVHRSVAIVDDAGTLLTKYVYPNGVRAARDAAHAKDVSNYMQQHSIAVPIHIFLNSADFAADRRALARQLSLMP